MEREETPGLKRISRGDGTERLMWACSEPARRAGFRPRTMNLSHLAANPAGLAAACRRLTVEMAAFLRGAERAPTAYDGTFATLLAIYETHPQSPYHKLAPSSARPYSQYARRLKRMIGAVRIDETTSADMSEWFDIWAGPDGHVAGARMTIAVLKAALTFGKGLRLQGCADLREIISEMRFSGPRPRESAPSFDDVLRLMKAAHKAGRPSMALTIALQFEGAIRLWDVVGQWVPLGHHAPSVVVYGEKKWLGLTWSEIRDGVLTFRPNKTAKSSGASQKMDLSMMPLALAELERIPEEARSGPLVVAETTGRPWGELAYRLQFAKVREAAGLPTTLWARDLRAGAVTEAREAGAATDDVSKVAGHTRARTTAEVYDRQRLESHRRVSTLRIAAREKDKNEP